MSNMMAKPNQADLLFIKKLLESGEIMPVIDTCYPLSEVPEALKYIAQGHAKGKIIITMPNHPTT